MAAMTNFKTIGRGALFALVAASATIATTSTYAVPAYDGLWSVSIITENGTGRLSGNLGEGSWSGGDCSGTWTAERRS
jgi:hypothetical protein